MPYKRQRPGGMMQDRLPKQTGRAPLFAFIILGIGLVLVFAAISAALFVSRDNDRAGALVAQTVTVLSEALAFEAGVQSAVISERAFLLTGEDDFLADYWQATQAYRESRARIHVLTRDSSLQQLRLDELETISDNLSASMDRAIRRVQTEDVDIDISFLQRTDVDAMVADFSRLIQQFTDEERRLLRDRQREQLRSSRLSNRIILGSMVMLAGLFLLQIYVAQEQSRLQQARNRQMMEINTELETRVAERTRKLEAATRSLAEENLRVESLLRDLHHRVGNSLQLVASFIGLHIDQVEGEEAKTTLRAARERVLAIAATQRRLRFSSDHETVNARQFIETIVGDLRANLTFKQEIDIETDISDVTISSRDAVTIGVLLAELITNAVKYAFRGHESGVIRVALKEDEETGTLQLSVEDDGVGFKAGARDPHGGLGMRIIDRLVTALGGELRRKAVREGERPGARIEVRFPNPAV